MSNQRDAQTPAASLIGAALALSPNRYAKQLRSCIIQEMIPVIGYAEFTLYAVTATPYLLDKRRLV